MHGTKKLYVSDYSNQQIAHEEKEIILSNVGASGEPFLRPQLSKRSFCSEIRSNIKCLSAQFHKGIF